MALAALAPCAAQSTVGAVDFFANHGVDIEAIRAQLSVRAGDTWTSESRDRLASDIQRLLGRTPSDISSVCCDGGGKLVVYIGLADSSGPRVRLHPQPGEFLELPESILALYRRLDAAWERAAATGGGTAREGRKLGYALSYNPGLRAIQLRVRRFALENQAAVFAVARRSSNGRHRAIAADVIGYGQHSAEQIGVLTHCALDPDRAVRNNAIRALAVLASSGMALESPIPHDPFIALLASADWSDRNKSLALLAALTESRNGTILRAICRRALQPLIECARWSWSGHAYWPRTILGRIAGIDEELIRAEASEPSFVEVTLSRAPSCADQR